MKPINLTPQIVCVQTPVKEQLKKGYSFQISFKASTVKTGLDTIKRRVKGAIKDNELKEMSEFTYNFILVL